jgi:hypothetical protein
MQISKPVTNSLIGIILVAWLCLLFLVGADAQFDDQDSTIKTALTMKGSD